MQKKNLWLVALVSALTIAFVGGCPEEDKKTTAAKTPETTPAANKETYREWRKLDGANTGFADDKLNGMLVSGGNFYFATDNEGLVVWDGQDEGKGFTKLKEAAKLTGKQGDNTGVANKDISGNNKITKMVELDDKYVAFVSSAGVGAGGIGIVKDKAVERAWVRGATGLQDADINDLIVVSNDANAKFLYAAVDADHANSIVHQPLAGLVNNWVAGVVDTGANALTKKARAFGTTGNGDLLISTEPDGAVTAGFQRILKAGANNIGNAAAHIDTLIGAHAANLSADNGIWKNNKHALKVIGFGNRVILSTDDMVITIADITAANTSVKVADAAVHAFVKDGADGAYAFTNDKGILYVKNDGTLDDAKAFGKASLTTKFDVDAKGADFEFTNNILASHKDGKKTYYATGDKGFVVCEEKERDKK